MIPGSLDPKMIPIRCEKLPFSKYTRFLYFESTKSMVFKHGLFSTCSKGTPLKFYIFLQL